MSPAVERRGGAIYVNGIPAGTTLAGLRRRGLHELRAARMRMADARAARDYGRPEDVRRHVHFARLLHRSGRRNLEVAALAAAL